MPTTYAFSPPGSSFSLVSLVPLVAVFNFWLAPSRAVLLLVVFSMFLLLLLG